MKRSRAARSATASPERTNLSDPGPRMAKAPAVSLDFSDFTSAAAASSAELNTRGADASDAACALVAKHNATNSAPALAGMRARISPMLVQLLMAELLWCWVDEPPSLLIDDLRRRDRHRLLARRRHHRRHARRLRRRSHEHHRHHRPTGRC